MDAVKFIETVFKMCDSYDRCDECSFLKEGGVCPNGRTKDASKEKIVSIVERWAKDHPAKTRQSEFLKAFPDAKLESGSTLCIDPCHIESSLSELPGCKEMSCCDCRHDYWLTEVTDND